MSESPSFVATVINLTLHRYKTETPPKYMSSVFSPHPKPTGMLHHKLSNLYYVT